MVQLPASAPQRYGKALCIRRRPLTRACRRRPSTRACLRRPSAAVCLRAPSTPACLRAPSTPVCLRRPSTPACVCAPAMLACLRRPSVRTVASAVEPNVSAPVATSASTPARSPRRPDRGAADRRLVALTAGRRARRPAATDLWISGIRSLARAWIKCEFCMVSLLVVLESAEPSGVLIGCFVIATRRIVPAAGRSRQTPKV